MPTSGITGTNLVGHASKDKCSWYKGPTLLDLIENMPIEKRDPNGPLRIPILDKRTDNGLIIYGKIM